MTRTMDAYLTRNYPAPLLTVAETDNAREWLADIGYSNASVATDVRYVAYLLDNLYDGGLVGYIRDSDAWDAFQASQH